MTVIQIYKSINIKLKESINKIKIQKRTTVTNKRTLDSSYTIGITLIRILKQAHQILHKYCRAGGKIANTF